MAISRMQQPRQMYGLGSLVKKAVKGVTGAVKSFAKSDLGKAAWISCRYHLVYLEQILVELFFGRSWYLEVAANGWYLDKKL
jgi:hypothetical protein